MTTEEARELIHAAVVDEGERAHGSAWADLGAGSGTFTFALAELLGPNGRVVAVDREAAALESLMNGLPAGAVGGREADDWRPGLEAARVVPVRGDFRDPAGIPELDGAPLDGALFANSLHFDPEPGRTLERFARRLAPGGRLVVVEYQDRPPNPWVPHPLPLARLESVAAERGLGAPGVVGERPSSYGGFLYCAWLGPD